MTKAAELDTGSADRPTLLLTGDKWFEGTLGEHQGHGVWVPPGLDASWIMEGATVLEQEFGVEPFLSRDMVREVLRTVLPMVTKPA